MDFLRLLWAGSKRDHWFDGLQWLIWTAIGGFVPLWGGILLGLLLGESPTLSKYAIHGELLIYAASFAAAGLYLVCRDFHKKGFPSRSVMTLVLSMSLLFSAVIYAGIVSMETIGIKDRVDQHLNERWGLIMLIFSSVLASLIVVADNALAAVDPRSITQSQRDNLESEFENLDKDSK